MSAAGCSMRTGRSSGRSSHCLTRAPRCSAPVRSFPGCFRATAFTRKHLLHLGRDMTTPSIVDAGYVSGASSMMPRKAVDAAGHLDTTLWYHIDADYCKRMADAGYQCWYLPEATIIHLNHKGGTTASARARFRWLMMFEVHSYRYYRKHLQRSMWSPMRILVPLGLFGHFLILIAGPGLRRTRRRPAIARAAKKVRGALTHVPINWSSRQSSTPTRSSTSWRISGSVELLAKDSPNVQVERS